MKKARAIIAAVLMLLALSMISAPAQAYNSDQCNFTITHEPEGALIHVSISLDIVHSDEFNVTVVDSQILFTVYYGDTTLIVVGVLMYSKSFIIITNDVGPTGSRHTQYDRYEGSCVVQKAVFDQILSSYSMTAEFVWDDNAFISNYNELENNEMVSQSPLQVRHTIRVGFEFSGPEVFGDDYYYALITWALLFIVPSITAVILSMAYKKGWFTRKREPTRVKYSN